MPHYKNGIHAKVGDRVLVLFEVKSISDAEHCSCGLATVNAMQGTSQASLTVNLKDVCSATDLGEALGFSENDIKALDALARDKNMSVQSLVRLAVRTFSNLEHKRKEFPDAFEAFQKATDPIGGPYGCPRIDD